jgi:hypothetical protein
VFAPANFFFQDDEKTGIMRRAQFSKAIYFDELSEGRLAEVVDYTTRRAQLSKEQSMVVNKMIIKDLANCRYFQAADNTSVCELLHPSREELDLPYSFAHAILQPGAASLPHRLKTSTEVYFILEGVGEMHIDS